MTKKIYSMCMAVALLVAGVAMLGCKKDNNNPDQPKQVQTYKMSIQASKGTDQQANGPRRVLSLDGNTLNAAWQVGEKVTVYNETQSETLTGYLEAQTSTASTQLTGELTGSIAVGDKLTLKYLSPNYATQAGTLEYISENCDYAVAENVEVEKVEGNTIYTSAEAAFENRQAIVKFTLKNEDGTATIAAKPLVIEVAGKTYTVTPASATSEMFVALPGFENKTITMTATVGSDTYTYEKASATLTNGQYYILTVEMTKLPEGAINGKFSVSPSLKVYFSKGNLQYKASPKTWRFAENQYDAVGGSNGSNNVAPYNYTTSANHSPSASQTGWIDLFGWAASGITRDGVNAYQPYSTSRDDADYGTTSTKSASETLGNFDWGKNMGTGWRTLTAEEWGYLLGPGNGGITVSAQRANYQSLRGLCKITVSGTAYPGMIILPDGLNNHLPSEGDIATKWAACAVEAGSLYYTKATFTEAEWTALQAAGAVFLPAAGYRGKTVQGAGVHGNYWSSSASSDINAFYLNFYAGSLYPENSSHRYTGRSVRLVKNAN